jgi:hypothetical protein
MVRSSVTTPRREGLLRIDFDETFAPVVKLTSIRIMCALAVRLQLHFHHLDVDTALLNSPLQENYMRGQNV